MKDKITSIIISVVENGYLVNPHSLAYGPCHGVQGPLYVYNNLGDLQRQLPALLGEEEPPRAEPPPPIESTAENPWADPLPGPAPAYLNIDINGRNILRLEGYNISYQEIVDLAETAWGKTALHTVTYSRGRHYEGILPKSGTVMRGDSIPVSEGLLIGAVVTGAA